MGYHLNKIPKGELGKWSKIEEEWAEFADAGQQGSKIMMLVELADVFGAIRAFYNQYYMNGDAIIASAKEFEKVKMAVEELGFTIEDVAKFADITERAFKSRERK